LASEQYCHVYHRLHGLETVCLRYFNVYGPRQRADSPYSGVIAKFIEAARAGQPITIFGDGEQTRDFCHVKDVAAANYLAATSPSTHVAGEIFNIGTRESISVKKLAGVVASVFGAADKQPTYGPPRAAEIRYSRADTSKSLHNLAWRAAVSLDEKSIAMCGGCS
jgi:nucleoside-diphosphate-sugar epimerase